MLRKLLTNTLSFEWLTGIDHEAELLYEIEILQRQVVLFCKHLVNCYKSVLVIFCKKCVTPRRPLHSDKAFELVLIWHPSEQILSVCHFAGLYGVRNTEL